MSWFKKVSALEQDWWRRLPYHLSRILPFKFKESDCEYLNVGFEPVFCKNKSHIIKGTNSLAFVFVVSVRSNVYYCHVEEFFDKNITNDNLENLQLKGFVYQIRKNMGPGFEGEHVNHATFGPQTTPDRIVEYIERDIRFDKDSGEDEPEPFDDEPSPVGEGELEPVYVRPIRKTI